MAQFDLKNATLTIQDGSTDSAGPNTIDVTIGEGNITWTETKNREYLLNRGSFSGAEIRDGDEAPMDVTIDLIWTYISGGTDSDAVATIEDCLKQTGAASDWVSTDTDTCRPYAVDIIVTYTPVCTGDIETITLPDFRYETLNHDAKAGTISCSGKCFAEAPTIVHTAQSS